MLTLIKSPFIEYKLTILRNKKTSNSLFRQTMNEVSYLIAAEVLKNLKYKKISVQTPLVKTTGLAIKNNPVIVPILRAGLGLIEGFVKFLPDVEKGHIGLYRDEQTYQPVEYLCKLPKVKNKTIIVLDPMLATGNSSSAAIDLIKAKGVKIKDIKLVSLLAAPEGIKNINKTQKGLHILFQD
jgi:uracil phosphoribosyltransferase